MSTEPSPAASGTDEEAAAPADRRAGVPPVWTLAVIAVLVLGLALASFGYLHERSAHTDDKSADAASRAALAAGERVAADFTTYDYRTLVADFGRTRGRLTSDFQKKYDQTTEQLTATLTQYKASSSSKVQEAAVVSSSASKAVVMAFIDQTITNSTEKTPRTDRVRMKLTLAKVGGSWLASSLDLV
jgi:Mce-associated membrane protein